MKEASDADVGAGTVVAMDLDDARTHVPTYPIVTTQPVVWWWFVRLLHSFFLSFLDQAESTTHTLLHTEHRTFEVQQYHQNKTKRTYTTTKTKSNKLIQYKQYGTQEK